MFRKKSINTTSHFRAFVLSRFRAFVPSCLRAFALSCLLSILPSCLEEKIEPETPGLKRNILFYIATGDNSSIDDDTQGKIDSIRAGWKPEMGEMIIYADRRRTGAALYRINEKKDTKGWYGLDTLVIYGVENSADASKITRAINYMTTHYPADSYGMIF
ncbi:MAG: hypothetical protein LBN11_04885, partial [Tannerella sp.]|nr:hypothetical protein [Tannerella sp.]